MKNKTLFFFLLFLSITAVVGALTIVNKNSIDMNGQGITGLPTPTADTDGVTKAYVDAFTGGGGATPSPFLADNAQAASEAGDLKLVNLNDTAQMSNLQQFREVESTSAHVTGLGILPREFLLIARDDTLIVHNIRTNADYVKFQGGTNNAIPASCDLRGIDFLDGFAFATCHSAGGGVIRIDFATGEIKRWTESGPQYYGNGVRGGIANRNGGESYREIAPVSGREWDLVDDEAFDVSASRYLMPHTLDAAGRRMHFITVGAVAGLTILSPREHDAKDATVVTPSEIVQTTEKGHLFVAGDNGTEVDIRFYQQVHGLRSSATIDADEVWDNDATQALDLHITDAATLGGFDVVETEQWPRMVLGTSEGGFIIDYTNLEPLHIGERQYHIHNKIEGDKNYPPYFGSNVNVWAFEAATPEDGGPDGEDLNGADGTPTYSAGVVGNAVHLNGSSNVERTVSYSFSTDSGFVFAWWCSTAATGAQQRMLTLDHSSGASFADLIFYIFATTGEMGLYIDDGTAGTDNFTYGIAAGETPPFGTSASPVPGWHHIAVTRDSAATGFFRFFIDGTQVDSNAVSNAAGTFTVNQIYVGSNESSGEYLTGAIDDLVLIGDIEYPPKWYIERLYQRGLAGKHLSAVPNDAMDATAVVAVAAHGPYTAMATADSVTVFNEHGLPFARYGTTSGTINAIDLTSNFDGLPVVAIGATTSFRIVVNPTDTNQVQGLSSRLPQSRVSPEVLGNPCVVDSTGRRGLWWDIDAAGTGPFVACSRADVYDIEIMPGTYLNPVTIDVDNVRVMGRGYRTQFREYDTSATTDHFVVTGDNVVVKNITVGTIGDLDGNTGTADAIRIETGQYVTLDNVHVIEADVDGIQILDAPETTIINCQCAQVDRNCIRITGTANHSTLFGLRVPVFSGGSNRHAAVFWTADSSSVIGSILGGETAGSNGSLLINAGGDTNIIFGNNMHQDFTDNGTGNTSAANETNP